VSWGTTVVAALLALLAVFLLVRAGRVRREVEALIASVARLNRLRVALDALRSEATTTRRSTDTTADIFAHRAHR